MPTYSILPAVEKTINKLINEFDLIPDERKALISYLREFVAKQKKAGAQILLNFICTHNSRRSHIAQVWAQTAAHYFSIDNVEAFSGGTEATAFNPRAVEAIKKAGFGIKVIRDGHNPIYSVRFSEDAPSITVFSKRYNDDSSPKEHFAAVMTCSEADEHCPIIPNAHRIRLPYQDPKEFDETPLEASKYSQRVHEIGREMLFLFSTIK